MASRREHTMHRTGRTIRVTGPDGFIGRVLVPALEALEDAHWFGREGAMTVHLGADTAGGWHDNVYGTAKALADLPSEGRFIFASTLNAGAPVDQYEHEKALGEQMVLARPDSNAVVLRLGCVYGPSTIGQGAKRSALNQIVTLAVERHQVRLYGNVLGRRDYVHLTDVVAAFVAALTAPPGVYDVGTGIGVSLSGAVDLLATLLPGALTRTHLGAPTGRDYPVADPQRFLPGWQPTIDLHDGLRDLLAWYDADGEASA